MKRPNTRPLAASAVCLVFGAASADASLITNGDFETGDLTQEVRL